MAETVTLRARVALDDCRSAYIELKETTDPNVFRRRWFGFIALLRGIGNVLCRVDGDRSAKLKAAISRHSPVGEAIFDSFIKKTRDLTLKEYRSGLFSIKNPKTSPMSVYTSAMAYQSHTAMSEYELYLGGSAPIPYVFRDGPYQGRDLYSVIDEALEFWDAKLTAIEREIGDY